ncbi:MAG TPA: glycosyltransferase family 4 protein [Candidatus Limnocylindrales bacterium]|nr:glycosyltransferase family 4 protein [Candidatus Limnocylindrales bacterium]
MRPRPTADLARPRLQRPLRIAQVAPAIEQVPPAAYGGTERIVHELTTKLVEAGHDVTVFASGDSNVPCRLIPTVERALRPIGVSDFRRSYETTIEMVRERMDDFDIIHSHLESWSIPLARDARVPVVATFHGRLDLPWTSHAFDSPPDGLVAISRSQASAHPYVPWTIIHNGLTLDRAPHKEHPSDALCFVGRVDPEKGIVEAMEIAQRTGRRLRIAAKVGTLRHQVDYYEQVFKPALKKAGRNIEYLGEVQPKDRDELFADSAVTLMPHAWPEPFGLVAIESLACGTPVLARRVGGLPEIIREGVDGYFCDDVTAFAFNLEKVPGLDRSAIRSRVIDRFSAQRMADRYQELYARMVDQHAIAASRAATASRGRSAGTRAEGRGRGNRTESRASA